MTAFLKRSASAILFAIVVIGGVWFSPFSFFALLILIQVLGLLEFFQLTKYLGYDPSLLGGLLLSVSSLLTVFLIIQSLLPLMALTGIAPLLFFVLAGNLYHKSGDLFGNSGVMVLGWLYLTIPLCLLAGIGFDSGTYKPVLVLLPIFLTWINDTMAYIVGVTLGKNPVWESVSPKKTWEGTIGGIILTIAGGGLMSLGTNTVTPYHGAIMGLIVAFAGVFGDLLESLLKRKSDAKDSGQVLPGHGGVLDRFDALLFAIPFVFIYVEWFV